MADAKLNAIVMLSDRMSKPLKGLNKQLRDMQRPFKALSSQVRQLDRLGGFKQLRQGLGGVARIVGRGGAIGGAALVGGFTALAKGVVDTSAQFEKYEAVLTSIEGSNEKAKQSMAWVEEFAKQTPFRMESVMDSFVSLKTFGIDPMDGSMQALVDASAKMGGSQEHLAGIILGVGQAWTKGKLQGEEALQLIERGIPVWDLLANASNKTAVELQEMSSKGQLGRDAIAQLIKAMGSGAIGASAQQMNTWNGLMSNLVDQWDRFKLLIGSSGIFDVLRNNMEELLKTVEEMSKNGQLQKVAESLSNMMVSGFETGKAFAKDLIPAMKRFAEWVKEVSPKMVKFVDSIGGLKTVAIGIAAVIAGPLISALATLSVALLTTPVGWFIMAVGAIVGAAGMIVGAWNPIEKFFPNLWDGIVNTVGRAIHEMVQLFLNFTPMGLIIKHWEPITNFFSDMWESISGIFDAGLKKIQPIIDTLTGVADAITKPYKKLFELGGDVVGAAKEGAGNVVSGAKNLWGRVSGDGGINSKRQGTDVGGRIEMVVTQGEPPRVKSMKSNNPNVPFDVYAGMSGVGM